MSDKPSIHCLDCGLTQFAALRCRRCMKPLFVRLDASITSLPTLFDAFESLPTVEEMEAELIEEAIRRSSSKEEAAALIGIGKTTIYRKVRVSQAERVA